jgi:hypothetical protein
MHLARAVDEVAAVVLLAQVLGRGWVEGSENQSEALWALESSARFALGELRAVVSTRSSLWMLDTWIARRRMRRADRQVEAVMAAVRADPGLREELYERIQAKRG